MIRMILTHKAHILVLTIDSRGRIVNADSPSSLNDYGIVDAQPLDSDLTSRC